MPERRSIARILIESRWVQASLVYLVLAEAAGFAMGGPLGYLVAMLGFIACAPIILGTIMLARSSEAEAARAKRHARGPELTAAQPRPPGNP